MRTIRGMAVGLCLLALAGAAAAQTATQGGPPPAGAGAARMERFDPEAATEAYLARLSPEKRARSDAYFEGGYWITLWGFLYGLGVYWLLLASGLSARMRDFAERATRFAPLRTLLYAVQYILVLTLLFFPFIVYTDFFREHQYGMATQGFAAWMVDQLKALGVTLVLGGAALMGLYGVLRRAPRTWWLWGAIVAVLFLVVAVALGPVFIEPIFNDYTELRNPGLREPILSLARANGIPARHVYMVDASRQTKRISANVAGMFGTTRIALNDNLLKRVSPAGIKAVMGHEMGHYVLNHVYESILYFAVVLTAGFAFLRWGFERIIAGRGERWGVRGVSDTAGLPLLAALLSVFFFVLTPLNNTFIRTNEAEADIFGLNASQEPDGFAEVALKLSEYRKLSPGPVEEWIFYDHPSGRDRILMAMRWKAEHLGEH
jgi:STE24 endopeptidase